MRGKKAVTEHGLGKNVPRSLRTEVERYLREREASPEWFDSTVLVARDIGALADRLMRRRLPFRIAPITDEMVLNFIGERLGLPRSF